VRGEERESFFVEDDIRFIDSIGYDHIRLPVDEEQMWDEQVIKTRRHLRCSTKDLPLQANITCR